MCEEGSVPREDGKFGYTTLGWIGSEGPRSGVFYGVLGGKGEGAEGDAQVEVGEDELDANRNVIVSV